MFMNHKTNLKINRLQERSLRILYKDDTSTFEQLLHKDNSVTVHTRNIRLVATERYKAYHGISPDIICDIFPKAEIKWNLRNQKDFETPRINTVWGSVSLRYLGPQVWNIVPINIKASPNLKKFKIDIKKWEPKYCPSRLCKTYMTGIGFI